LDRYDLILASMDHLFGQICQQSTERKRRPRQKSATPASRRQNLSSWLPDMGLSEMPLMSQPPSGVEDVERWRSLRIAFYGLLRLFAALSGIACLFLGAASLRSGKYWTFALSWFCSGLFSGLFTLADDRLTLARVTWSDEISPVQLAYKMSSETEFNYGLVLRPFDTDAQIRMQNTLNPFVVVGIGFGMPIIDIQEWIIRYSPRNWRWFSWGGKVGPIRPIRIISNDKWFEELKPIVKLADVVIMIPGPSDSISKEFDFLLDERAHHAVMLFPPRLQNDGFCYQIRGSKRFAEFLTDVPNEGCFFLPYQRPDFPHVDFAKYPLNSRSLKRILKARRNAVGN
jgi:hypothetical protein